jgi:hypothetical protein
MLVDFIPLHVLLFHGAIDQLPNLLEIWHDHKGGGIMFQKDFFEDCLLPIFSTVVGTLIF